MHLVELLVDLSPEEAAARLADPGIGWAYVDQKAFCPKLYALAALRTLIVKRSAITTVEVLVSPIRGRRKTHLVTGYVHKGYPRLYALLARHAAFDSALIVRGVEGGSIPSLAGQAFYYHDQGEEHPLNLNPADLGIDQPEQATPLQDAATFDSSIVARAAAQAGLEALAGQPGPARDRLVCAGALILWHLRRYDSLRAAADAVREVLDRGRALQRVQC